MNLDEHLGVLLGKLDLAEKVRLLTGASHWSLYPEPAIGLRGVTVSDGPAGVRGRWWDDAEPSACFPCPTAVAASWSEDRVADVGRLFAAEAARKGVDVLLAPTVNIQRSPVAGRHFECWSEDPHLTGRLAAVFVAALQRHGVAATVKHYVANDSETERASVDVRLDEGTLREVYLAPFEHIVRSAAPWLVMAAYNAVGGTTMTEHEMLDQPLRSEWGFDGVVISDWRAARSTVESGAAGLDLVMPGPHGPWGAELERAVEDGRVPESAIDAKVVNLLRLAARVGALESVPVDNARISVGGSELRAGLRAAATDGIVLLRNTGAVPLEPAVRRVAVFGELAEHPRVQGGGSAEVRPAQVVSPLDGIRAALPVGTEVTYTAGSYLDEDPGVVPPGLLTGVDVRWLDGAGTEVRRESRATFDLVRLGIDVPEGGVAVELTARMVPDATGTWQLGVTGAGRLTFEVGGETLLDEEVRTAHDGPGAAILTPPIRLFDVPLTAGRPVDVLLRHHPQPPGAAVSMRARPPRRPAAEELELARQRAREADVAIVVVGSSARSESEGFDRTDLSLPAGQDELVRAVAAENPNTIAVVDAGAPVLLPWRDDVAALLVTWFGGQEIGHALADVLTGRAEPGGRLPMTWPATEDVPVRDTTPVDGRLEYREGVHVGYRGWLRDGAEPAYPIGHGLGYTTWELMDLQASGETAAVTVRNTGDRPGKQVVQLYLARPESSIDRPVRWLAGFAAVRAEPGETVTVDVPLPKRAFEHWTGRGWVVEPGTFDVLAGFSATAIHAVTSLDATDAEVPRPIQ
jgi:beta-glucosidase